jgi:hypothetical protein
MLYNSGSIWPSVVVHEHWHVSQRMIVEMGDYVWSEHIVRVSLACQITIKSWKSFLLRPTDGRARVWRQWNTSFQDNHILSTTAFGGGCVTAWGCFSFDCKLDLYVLDGNLTGQRYPDNVLAPHVVPHFDNHALADRSMFMDDNTRPHRSQLVQHF